MGESLDEIIIQEEELNTRSQMEIATMIMVRKKYVYKNDVKVIIGNHTYDTIGCEDEFDFLKKYHNSLEEDGIKNFSIANVNDGQEYVVNIDSYNTNITYKNEYDEEIDPQTRFSITTEGCDNITDFKLKNQDVFNKILPKITEQILTEIGKKFENSYGLDQPIAKEENIDEQQYNLELQRLFEEQKKYQKMSHVLKKMQSGEILYSGEFVPMLSFEKREKELDGRYQTIISDQEMDLDLKKNEANAIIQKWNQLQEEKNKVITEANRLMEENNFRLQEIDKKIKGMQEKINMVNNNPPKIDVPITNGQKEQETFPEGFKDGRMLPKNNLEEDYYKRLENASKERPIFEDDKVSFRISPADKTPHIIKKISKASSKLINKIKMPNFKKMISKGLEFLKSHRIGATVATAALLAALSISRLPSPSGYLDARNDVVNTMVANTQTQEKPNTANTSSVENNNTTMENLENKADEQNFDKELSETVNSILDGNTKVYRSSDRAINDVNGLTPSKSQLENSWSNATPGAYYTLENNRPQRITEEEANNYWQDGGTIAVRMDNNGTPIGYVSVEQPENTSVKGM